MNRLSRIIATTLMLTAGLGAGVATWAGTIVLETEIVSMSLTGTGSIPLASDPQNSLGDSIDGYGFVNSDFIATESTQFTSSATTTWTLNTNTFESQVTTEFSLFLDLQLTDIDNAPGRDYAGQADGATLFLPAAGAQPGMSYSQTASLDLLSVLDNLPDNPSEADLWVALLDAVSLGTPTSTEAIYVLGQVSMEIKQTMCSS